MEGIIQIKKAIYFNFFCIFFCSLKQDQKKPFKLFCSKNLEVLLFLILKFNIFVFFLFFFHSLDVIVFFFACLNIETFFAKNQDQRAIRAKKISERANEDCNARTRPGARETGATVSVWHIIGLKANASQEAEKQSSFHP